MKLSPVPRQGHSSFGVQLDVTDKGAGPMITDIQPGAIASFNTQNPEQAGDGWRAEGDSSALELGISHVNFAIERRLLCKALQRWDTIAELEDAKGMLEVYEKMKPGKVTKIKPVNASICKRDASGSRKMALRFRVVN